MRSLEGAKGKREKFDRTRVCVSDRVRMCRRKRLGWSRYYEEARVKIRRALPQCYAKGEVRLEKEERLAKMQQKEEQRKAEFERKRAFMINRIRMCYLWILGK